ncbi:hypothetical protein [Nonomuraea polychroma]|uniref:hypothetical protein n=1 Tax=Nonomuraea polychroma TaxID=46176 RepID=UPI0019D4E6B6|nr:hypothetical protein [Nonomuraea polychroma]
MLRACAERSNITPSVRRNAADQIKYATAFLIWLNTRDRTLASCRQSDIDAWYAENPVHARAQVRTFLAWAMQSRQGSRSLSLPAGKTSRQAPMTEEQRLAALRRLLIDADVPPLLRVAGIIVLLYAQPLTRVVQLTVDDLFRDGEDVFLRLGNPPSPVPEPVASLLLDYIAARDNMNTATNRDSRWLFHGRRAGQPCRPDHLSALLRKIGVPAAAARGRRHPAAAPRDACPRRRRRTWLPRWDHCPSPQRRRWNVEPLRRRETRKITVRA